MSVLAGLESAAGPFLPRPAPPGRRHRIIQSQPPTRRAYGILGGETMRQRMSERIRSRARRPCGAILREAAGPRLSRVLRRANPRTLRSGGPKVLTPVLCGQEPAGAEGRGRGGTAAEGGTRTRAFSRGRAARAAPVYQRKERQGRSARKEKKNQKQKNERFFFLLYSTPSAALTAAARAPPPPRAPKSLPECLPGAPAGPPPAPPRLFAASRCRARAWRPPSPAAYSGP